LTNLQKKEQSTKRESPRLARFGRQRVGDNRRHRFSLSRSLISGIRNEKVELEMRRIWFLYMKGGAEERFATVDWHINASE
jgi:hypothetical protein